MLTDEAFRLLAELEANNDRDWFTAHRQAIHEEVQQPFARVLEAVTAELADADLPLKGGADTMFRMNRDVRFSHDKAPYNAHVSGVLTPGGTKKEGGGLLYLHMDARGGFLACGYYNLSPAELGPIRDRIAEQPERFCAVLDDLEAADLELSREQALTAMPRGYAEHADAWFAEHLKLKSLMVQRPLGPADWTGGGVVKHAARVARGCTSLLRFAAR